MQCGIVEQCQAQGSVLKVWAVSFCVARNADCRLDQTEQRGMQGQSLAQRKRVKDCISSEPGFCTESTTPVNVPSGAPQT